MKNAILGGALATAASMRGWLDGMIVSLFGVPLAVIAMAAAGTFLSASQAKPEKKNLRFYLKHVGYWFMAIVSVTLIPNLMGWDWVTPRLEGPIAGGMAYAARFWIPATLESIPEIVKKIFKLREYKDDTDEDPVEEGEK